MKKSGAEYEIRIKNGIGLEWQDWFAGMKITKTESGESVLRGYIRDQAELHGILNRVADLNLSLISVNRIKADFQCKRNTPDSKERTMKKTVISYSLTGNNAALAKSLAAEFSADHIPVTENRKRTMGRIVLDVLFNRVPKISVQLTGIEDADLIIFAVPVWMGKAASPLRSIFSELKGRIKHYVFVSVCGGADGPNPELGNELAEHLGRQAEAVIELHIAGLLPAEPKPKRKDTMHYRLDETEIAAMTKQAVTALAPVIGNKEMQS